MAKEATVKLGGQFRAGTAIGNLYQTLEDGKEHKWADLQKICKGAQIENRIGAISRHLKTAGLGQLLLDEENGLVRMELNAKGKALREEAKLAQAKVEKVEVKAKPAAKAPKAKGKAKATPKASTKAADAEDTVATA